MLDEMDAIALFCVETSMEADIIPLGLESEAMRQLQLKVQHHPDDINAIVKEMRIEFEWAPGTWRIGWEKRGGPRWTPWYWEIVEQHDGQLSFKGIIVIRQNLITAFEERILRIRGSHSMPEAG